MKIFIICIGKIKEKYLKDAICEYKKRLSKYCKLEIIEIADEKIPENSSPAEEEIIKKTEASKILKHLSQKFIVALCINGKELDSIGFSKFIQKNMLVGNSSIAFVIGGSLGLHKSIINKADFLLSFSKMTFPHQLMRIFLLEQLFRANKIIKNEPYHK